MHVRTSRLALVLALLAPAVAAPDGGPAGAPASEAAPLPAGLDGLKERITRARARPGALQGAADATRPTAHAVLVHRNEMGPSYALESATYVLDGATVYSKVDVDGDLAERRDFEVFAGDLAPGAHELIVRLVYRGVASGLSRYWDGHRFEVRATHRFGAAPGQRAEIRISGYERGDASEVPDRPAVRFESDVAAAAAPASSAPSR